LLDVVNNLLQVGQGTARPFKLHSV
jgi:hypothetical protein